MKLEEIRMRDPFILKDIKSHKYYLYGTFKVDGTNDFYAYVSDDLIDFKGPFRIFKTPKDFWGTKDFWAPEVHEYHGKYYLIATFKGEKTNRACQIFVSDSPLGNFEVHSEIVTPLGRESLDGTLYIENDEPYLIFVHEWIQIKDGEVCAIKLSKDLKKMVGEPITLFKASEASWSSQPYWAHFSYGVNIADGPFIVKDENGKVIILWSSYNDKEYVTGYAYNNSTSLFDAPFSQSKASLKISDGGHGMIFDDFSGRKFLIVHVDNGLALEKPRLYKISVIDNKINILV